MLHLGEEDLVTFSKTRTVGVGNQVYRPSGVPDEDELARRFGVDERLDLATRLLVFVGGLLGKGVDAPVDVGVVAGVVVGEGGDDGFGLLAGGGIVEGDQRPATAHVAAEDWEVVAEAGEVKGGAQGLNGLSHQVAQPPAAAASSATSRSSTKTSSPSTRTP